MMNFRPWQPFEASKTPEFVGKLVDWDGDGVFRRIQYAGVVRDGRVYLGSRCPETGVMGFAVFETRLIEEPEDIFGNWTRTNYQP